MRAKLNLDLEGKDGNGFMLIGYFRKMAKREGWTEDEIEETTKELTKGDYDNLLRILVNI